VRLDIGRDAALALLDYSARRELPPSPVGTPDERDESDREHQRLFDAVTRNEADYIGTLFGADLYIDKTMSPDLWRLS
jgi:hypothetical protein